MTTIIGSRPFIVRAMGGFLGCLLLALVILATFPWAVLKERIAADIGEHLGGKVTIGEMRRLDTFSFTPRIELRDVILDGPAWAGRDKLAEIGRASFSFSAWHAVTGRVSLKSLDLRHATIVLVRREDGLESWSGRKTGERDKGSGLPSFVTATDTKIVYRDAKQDRGFAATLAVSPEAGLKIEGAGHVHGHPVRIAATGKAISSDGAASPWPFKASIAGDTIAITISGHMDRPLDVRHLSGDVTARASDLALVDAVIEAGLPETQPIDLRARVRRDGRDWNISSVTGTIGRSDVSGRARIDKQGDRTRIDGSVVSRQFDFDDLASDEGLARAVAKRARFGLRLIPDTAIDLATVSKTDGRLELSVGQLLWPGPSPLRSLKATLELDRSRLTLSPVVLGLSHGTISGRATVDQRSGAPILTLDLILANAQLADFFPAAAVQAPLNGIAQLNGPGRTVRQAVGASTGIFGLTAGEGRLPARTASLLGQDLGRAITSDADDVAGLRCLAARFEVKGGTATTSPVLIDTTRALTRVSGSITLWNEALSLSMKGAPKKDSLLRLEGSVPISGPIKQPLITVPKKARSFGGVLKMLGRAITGKQDPTAEDLDCTGAMHSALRKR